jgi:hypothetical protein
MKRTLAGLNSVILWILVLFVGSCAVTQPTGKQYLKFENSFLDYAKLDSVYSDEKKTQETWLEEIRLEYAIYELSDSMVSKDHMDSMKVEIICGSWCHDTREQVSRFSKILDSLSFPLDSVNYHFVDRDKNAYDSGFATQYEFSNIPVFVFYRNGAEIGSIIETPDSTLEVDMKTILKK